MSVWQQNLPKPPPKAPPKAPPKSPAPPYGSGAARSAATAPVNAAMMPAAPLLAAKLSVGSGGPAAPPIAPSPEVRAIAPARPPSVDGLTMPRIDPRGLPEHMGPMVEAIQLYDDLLAEENVMLKASDAKGVSILLERKMSATRLYQERLRAVLSDSDCTRSLSIDQRATIVSMVKCLEARAHENTILLKANMGAIEQVFEVINTAARKMRRREVAYSKAGTICDSYSPHSVSLAFNQSI